MARRPPSLRQQAFDYERGFCEPIHPLWLDGRVPQGYWTLAAHRRGYMIWLGRQLGFKQFEDWYRLQVADFKRHRGGGLLAV